MAETAGFQEASAAPKVAEVPLSHLSIELGHLYLDDYKTGPDRLKEHFAQVAPWARAAEEICSARLGVPERRRRVSTCFLIDDYFGEYSTPEKLIPEVLDAAEEAGLRIDYLARESGCAQTGHTSPARIVEARLVEEPAPGSNGARPPVGEVGWLCNGERSPRSVRQAFGSPPAWAPPRESAPNRHSVFVDIELWDGPDDARVWSCPFLAAVWQLLRLGLLRDEGAVVAAPEEWKPPGPDSWARIPTVLQVNAKAAPFAAYRTLSVLGPRFLQVEHAVRTILGQVMVEETVGELVAKRAGREGITLPPEITDRIEYVFAGT